MSTSTSTSAPVVLVTGANGYIGAAIVLELVKQGYKVKAPVRRASSAKAFHERYPKQARSIEWVVLPNLTDRSGMTAALADVDYVIHVASPFFYNPKDNEKDLLIPAREIMLSVLESAAKHPRIKHIVVMSSFAAVLRPDGGMGPDYTYSDDDWNPVTWEVAARSDFGPRVYAASKVYAEKAAWSFMEKERPSFSLTSLCPPMVWGPSMQPFSAMDELNGSVIELWDLFSGRKADIMAIPVWVDLRDVAKISVQALTNEKAKNQRYIAVAGHYTVPQLVDIVRKAFPDQAHRLLPQTGSPPPHFGTNTEKIEKDFGIQWTSLEKCIVDTAADLFQAEGRFRGTLE